MNILIIHQNFPGQFKHIALDILKEGKHRLLAIAHEGAPGMQGVEVARYKLGRANTQGLHRYLVNLESGVIRGQAVAKVLIELKQRGYRPDVVLCHPGWGEALFLKDVFPAARLVSFFEFFYQSSGADTGFDPDQQVTIDEKARIRVKNSLHLLNLEFCDAGVSPTRWQKSVHPQLYHHKIAVCHEGIDTQLLKPAEGNESLELPNGTVIRKGDPVLTYVARNLEPYRGFIPFMRSLPLIVKRCPQAQIVIVGGDEVSYGAPPRDARNWREKLSLEIDVQRYPNVHFLGKIPYARYSSLLRISKAHIYLTYPFVLSWSMMEAMSSGALLIASRTTPVEELIEDGANGLLVDFFDTEAIADKAVRVLQNDVLNASRIRERARRTIVEGYDVRLGNLGYRRLLDAL